ncbi:beta-glucosidase [Streptomyces sp. NPDC102364]|uniref:beta-glucosidase family protein n=1 Tax=Streptomyces sp. NPDC102364 TaxID=3366161 RepID=UPI0038008B30
MTDVQHTPHDAVGEGRTVALKDAVGLTTGTGYWTTHAVPEAGIRSLRMADGPHGLRVQDDENPDHLGLERSAPATCFPPAVTLACSWDNGLIEQVGAALGREARAAGVDVVLGPGLNIKRSPLCGRNFEYYSEDPLLAGTLAAASARGIQSEGVGACLKHFAVNNQETDRLRISANVDLRTLHEIYLRAFEIAIRASQPWAIMSSYNRINGVHASENHWLLTEVLRDTWGYDGLVVSDWGAVTDPVAAVQAGLDLRMPGRPEDPRVGDAVAAGLIQAETLQRTAARTALLCERVAPAGETTDVDLGAHHDLVRRAAAESAVLLTNDGTLPLDLCPGLRIGVVGELARSPRYQGGGSSYVNPTKVISGLDALTARAEAAGAVVEFAPGYTLATEAPPADLTQEATGLAARSDVVIAFLGLPQAYEAEGRDRTHIDLPADQLALLQALEQVPTPVAVALSNGSAVSTAAWRHGVAAITEFWLTGQAHGDAIADVLLGAVNPSGKLTETVPIRLADTPAYLGFPGEHGVVNYGEGVHVGYRWFDAREMEVDYPFGHGLSYSEFRYSDLRVTVRPADDPVAFAVEVTVRNVSSRDGSEVVQVYVADPGAGLGLPAELRGWDKVHVPAGESRIARVDIAREDLAHWNLAARNWAFEGGTLKVRVGASSRDVRLEAAVDVPGKPVIVPLNLFSTLGEWLDHPVLGHELRALLDARGGIQGRIGDLLADEAGQDSVRGIPVATVLEFPGVPVNAEDAERLLVASV